MRRWPLTKVETGSYFAWRHQMNVCSICASISVTIIDIWTQFGTEHIYHTIDTPPSWISEKNVNNSGLDKDILHQKCIMTMRKWPCDRKSKPEVNSRDDLLMVDFKWKSEASVHRSQWLTNADIWTKFGTGHKYHTVNTPEWPNSHKLKIKMADLRWYHSEWLTEVQRILEF